MHGRAIPGGVYRTALAPMLGDVLKTGPDPSAFAQSVIADMAPKDPAEEMLVAQLLFAHARVMRLTALANQQTELEALSTVHEYADRASNTYRRLMLALAEYRRPPRTGDTFAVVKQTNIAGQQVIQNNEKSATTPTNEQGCQQPGHDTGNSPKPPAALPADTGGVDLSSLIRPPREAVGAVHRAADARGESAVQRQRSEAR